jgi:hypothetical protein
MFPSFERNMTSLEAEGFRAIDKINGEKSNSNNSN